VRTSAGKIEAALFRFNFGRKTPGNGNISGGNEYILGDLLLKPMTIPYLPENQWQLIDPHINPHKIGLILAKSPGDSAFP